MSDPRDNEPDLSRRLPYDVDVEQALLGAILVDNYHLASVADLLKPDDFYDALHQRLFTIAMRFFAQDRKFTPLTAKPLMEKDAGFVEVGGGAYLTSLARAAPAFPNVKDYARILRELAVRRSMIRIGEDLINTAYDMNAEESIQGVAETASEQLYEATRGAATDEGSVEIIELAHRAVKLAEDAKNAPADVCLTSGLVLVDDALGGVYRGDVTVLGGAPNMGKTALAEHIAIANARAGHQVLFFSLEMTGEQIATREIAEKAKVPSDRIRRGKISNVELDRLCLAPGQIDRIPLRIDATPGLTVAQMRARAMAHRRRHKSLALIVIDHLRYIRPANPRAEERDQIQQITRDLKAMAKEMGVGIILVSHVNREAMKRSSRRPILTDLYGAAAIEQNADAVWFVHREAYYLEREKPDSVRGMKALADWDDAMEKARGWTEIFAAKQRMGPIGEAKVKFDPMYTRYSDPDAIHDAQKTGTLFNDLAGLPEKRG